MSTAIPPGIPPANPPAIPPAIPAAEPPPKEIESLLAMAGIDFELVHEGPGNCCHGCPTGLDLAA
jgi:hypothetical protein